MIGPARGRATKLGFRTLNSNSNARYDESGGSAACCRSAVSIPFNGDGAWTRLFESAFGCAHPVELAFCFRQFFQVSPLGNRMPCVRGFRSVYDSVGAAIRIVVCVIWVVRAIETVAVIAAAETVPSSAKVLGADVCHSACAKATHVACANATNATSAKATDAGSAEAAHASAEATHVAAAKAAAHVASAKAATAKAAT